VNSAPQMGKRKTRRTHNPSANSLSGCHNANLPAMNEPQSCPITIYSSINNIAMQSHALRNSGTHSLVHSDDVQKRSEVCAEPSRRVLLRCPRLVCAAVPEHVWHDDTVSRAHPRSNLISPAVPTTQRCVSEKVSREGVEKHTICRESRGRREWCVGMMRDDRACGRQSGTSVPW
jgi:hypothetical protein